MSAHPTMSGALDASGTQTAFVPTTEDLRRLWLTGRHFSNYPEKAEHIEGFETWLTDLQATAAAAERARLHAEFALTAEAVAREVEESREAGSMDDVFDARDSADSLLTTIIRTLNEGAPQ